MIEFPLSVFTEDAATFPFVVQYGFHEKSMYMHTHKDFSELVILLNGSAEHIVDEEHYRIRRGDVFVISQDTAHGYEDTRAFEICNIMFRPEFFFSPSADIAQCAGFQALFVVEPHAARAKQFCSRLKLDFAQYAQVREQIQRLIAAYTGREPGWQTMVTAEFLQLVVTLSRWYRFQSSDAGGGNLKLAVALAYMEGHFAEPLSVTQLATLAHYSERQFIRLFRETLCCTPSAYLTNLRMQKARELLKTTSLPMAEIAARCGYCDSNYFSRMFRKCNDMTPSAFRAVY